MNNQLVVWNVPFLARGLLSPKQIAKGLNAVFCVVMQLLTAHGFIMS
jgi:hypothetical protein